MKAENPEWKKDKKNSSGKSKNSFFEEKMKAEILAGIK